MGVAAHSIPRLAAPLARGRFGVPATLKRIVLRIYAIRAVESSPDEYDIIDA